MGAKETRSGSGRLHREAWTSASDEAMNLSPEFIVLTSLLHRHKSPLEAPQSMVSTGRNPNDSFQAEV